METSFDRIQVLRGVSVETKSTEGRVKLVQGLRRGGMGVRTDAEGTESSEASERAVIKMFLRRRSLMKVKCS